MATSLETPHRSQPYVPAKQVHSDYPLIDSDPHFKRVVGYARPSDLLYGTLFGAGIPGSLLLMERVAPSGVGKGGFPPVMRLAGALGITAGFLLCYSRSINRFYGFTENRREVEMDMREMVTKVKKGEA